jgi:hypothetical protein
LVQFGNEGRNLQKSEFLKLTFGLAYSPLNSAKLSCSSEVTLICLHST